jgi:isocitrate lyase
VFWNASLIGVAAVHCDTAHKLDMSFSKSSQCYGVTTVTLPLLLLQVDLLTHQRWSGAELLDRQVKIATGGISSTSAMGEGVTESQFAKAPRSKL